MIIYNAIPIYDSDIKIDKSLVFLQATANLNLYETQRDVSCNSSIITYKTEWLIKTISLWNKSTMQQELDQSTRIIISKFKN